MTFQIIKSHEHGLPKRILSAQASIQDKVTMRHYHEINDVSRSTFLLMPLTAITTAWKKS